MDPQSWVTGLQSRGGQTSHPPGPFQKPPAQDWLSVQGPRPPTSAPAGEQGSVPLLCLPHPGPVTRESTGASETEEEPCSKAAAVPVNTATTHPSPDSAATGPASTRESLGHADFRQTHQNHTGESPEHGLGIGSVKAAGDVLCGPGGGTGLLSGPGAEDGCLASGTLPGPRDAFSSTAHL